MPSFHQAAITGPSTNPSGNSWIAIDITAPSKESIDSPEGQASQEDACQISDCGWLQHFLLCQFNICLEGAKLEQEVASIPGSGHFAVHHIQQ